MRFARRAEFLLYAEVQLDRAKLEPAAASPGQRLRLGDLDQAQQGSIERPGLVLPANRHCQLDVIEPDNHRSSSIFAVSALLQSCPPT